MAIGDEIVNIVIKDGTAINPRWWCRVCFIVFYQSLVDIDIKPYLSVKRDVGPLHRDFVTTVASKIMESSENLTCLRCGVACKRPAQWNGELVYFGEWYVQCQAFIITKLGDGAPDDLIRSKYKSEREESYVPSADIKFSVCSKCKYEFGILMDWNMVRIEVGKPFQVSLPSNDPNGYWVLFESELELWTGNHVGLIPPNLHLTYTRQIETTDSSIDTVYTVVVAEPGEFWLKFGKIDIIRIREQADWCYIAVLATLDRGPNTIDLLMMP